MDWPLIIASAVGGSGIGGLLLKLAQLKREHTQGELQREDTAISRWQRIAEEREQQISELKEELSWYRAWYPRLYAAYRIGPPPGKGDYPPTPPYNTHTTLD